MAMAHASERLVKERVSGRWALALPSCKEEVVLAHVVRSLPYHVVKEIGVAGNASLAV